MSKSSILRDAMRTKHGGKLARKSWFLPHDNAPARLSFVVKKYLAKNDVTVLEHPPYSPDLSAPDFFPFPRLKSALKEQ
jgi:hypothetical protein